MKLFFKLLLIIFFANASQLSFAQSPVITKVTKFKPPVVQTFIGANTNGASITKDEASQLITLPLKIMDDKKNLYPVSSYHFLYKKKGTVQDENTGKVSPTFTNVSDFFKTTPLPKVWVDNLKNGFQKGDELYFFDIIVTDKKNRNFFAPDLKINVQ